MVKPLLARKMITHVIFGILLFFEGLSKREHCHKVLYVEDITQHSAVLRWETHHTVTEVAEDYKVLCAGLRQYNTVEGDREVDLDTVTQFVPRGVGQVFLGNLQSNFNYSCVVQAEGNKDTVQETLPLLFSTLYSVPEAPQPPVIAYAGKQISIQLFPTSTKYGPIDGYEVQFHILDKDTAHVHGQPDFPKQLTQPRGLLAGIEAARSSIHPIPFCIAFRNGSLPSHVSESFMQGALRTGTTYTVITVAYTDNYEEISRPLLYTLSAPSKTFSLTLTSGNVHSEFKSQSTLSWLGRQVTKSSMAVGVAISNLIILYFLVVGCCILYGEMKGSSQQGPPQDKQCNPVATQHSGIMPSAGPTAVSDVVNQTSSMVREATENGVYNVEVNSSEAHVGSSSGAIGCVEQPEQSLSGSLLQPYSPNVLQSTVSLQPSSVVAVMATSCPPVHSVIGSTLSDSATGLEGCSEQEKFLCGEKSSTPSATRPCVATEASTELTDGMPITEAADSGSEREDLHNTPEQSSVCESCSLLGKAVPAFGIHALDTSSTTEELRSPPENNMFAQESSEKRKFLQLGISAILKKATRSVESSSVHSGWSSSSTGVGQDDTSAMTHDIQSVSDAHLVRSEQSDGAVSDYSHHSALLSSCELHLVPYVPHDLRSATEGGVQGATQWVEPSGSSLVFVPRGLSGGPRAPSNLPLPPGNPDEDISVNTTGNDLAPDMEMDLYGISYSLDSLDH